MNIQVPLVFVVGNASAMNVCSAPSRTADAKASSRSSEKAEWEREREKRRHQERGVSNWIVTWTPDGSKYESDQRHAEIIVKHMGLKLDLRSVATPAIRAKPGEVPDDEEDIEPREQTIYREIVA